MTATEAPIGIFDSGVGGLTVFRAIRSVLPNESLVYLGDTARVPYGTKSRETVQRYSREICRFLSTFDAKLIVVACNTASAFALDVLQNESPVPVVGVVEPGARAAVSKTRNRKIGIIGTEGTIRSGVYEKAIHQQNTQIECFAKSTGLLVPLIEEGILDAGVLHSVFEFYLSEFLESGVDTLVLGCTHYPILEKQIHDFFAGRLMLVNSAETTALEVQSILNTNTQAATRSDSGKVDILVTDAPDRVQKIADRILGEFSHSITRVSLSDE